MDRIVLTGMRFEGHHGATDDERALPQLLEVDLEVELDLTAAASSDALEDTVDYGPLVEIARRTVESRSFRLLEAIAGAIAASVVEASSDLISVTVRVRKLAVPIDVDMDHAAVELHRGRRGDDRTVG